MTRVSSKLSHVSPETSAGYQVRRCHRRFDRLLSAHLSKRGVKTGFWYYLRILWIEDGVSQKYLSDMTNVAENTTASLISAMVADGLVMRERDGQDRRRLCIRLTDRGRALEGELLHFAAEINATACAGIEQSEIDQCLSVLRRMSENLSTAFQNQQEAFHAPGVADST